MKIIEGTVQEIVEYQKLTASTSEAAEGGAVGGNDAVPEDTGNETVPARSVSQFSGEDEDSYFVRQFVYTRATSAASCRRVLDYLERVLDLGTYIEVGTSQNSKDGYNNYLMIRDDGKQRFGAVAYVKPHNSGLTIRLRPEDVEDLDDAHIREREVVATQQYALNCPLVDDAAVETALELTKRALVKVRGE
ncbi:hypothetical protein [Pedococcus soli]